MNKAVDSSYQGRLRVIALLALVMGIALLTLGLLLCVAQAPVFAQDATDPATTDESNGGALPPATLPNGVASGDVSQHTAVLWARSTATGTITFTYGINLVTDTVQMTTTVSDPWIPIKVLATGLTSNTEYQYQVTNAVGDAAAGRFHTNADVGEKTGLRFGVGGDANGALLPYVAVRNVPARDLQFFVMLGDSLYADYPTPALEKDIPENMAEMRIKHSEVYSANFGLNYMADLRASTSIMATIDDHEVINNFAGGGNAADDANFPETHGYINDTAYFENGLQGFMEFQPLNDEYYGLVDGSGRMDYERKLYRYRTYGSDAALFMLDLRSFRDLVALEFPVTMDNLDIPAYLESIFTTGRTMLGKQQLADLKADLLKAQKQGITWKFVAVSLPIQPIGQGGSIERFEGYAEERSDLLKFIEDHQITNVVFLGGDVHGSTVNDLTYQTGPDAPVVHTNTFEVTSPGTAVTSAFGPAIMSVLRLLNIITEEYYNSYLALPVAVDADTEPNDKDDFFRAFIDSRITPLGYDAIGLEGSSIKATLLQGDYMVAHAFGWTEIEIDQETQKLTVTIYGIDTYTADDLATNSADVLARMPTVITQFEVLPATPSTPTLYLPFCKK
ncbi:MAG: alkaline phosphatase D family protein [Caldilineaceae bacterium]